MILEQDNNLQSIDVNNYAEDDIPIIADFPINQFIKFNLILPFILFFSTLFLVILFPYTKQTIIQTEKLNYDEKKNIYSIESFLANIKPLNEFIKIYFRFDKILNQKSIFISGTASILCFNEEEIICQLNSTIKPLNLIVSQIDWNTNPILLFNSENINFDSLNVSLYFNSSNNTLPPFTFLWETRDQNYILLLSSIKIIYISYLIYILIFYSIKFLSKYQFPISHILTSIHMVSFIIKLNPFSLINYFFPIMYNEYLPKITNDFYLIILMFYFLSLFSTFGLEKKVTPKFILTLIFIFISGITLLINFFLNYKIINYQIMPNNININNFSIFHLIIFIGFLFLLIYFIYSNYLKFKEEDQQEYQNLFDRFYYFFWIVCGFTFSFIFYYILLFTTPLIKNNSLEELIPITLSMMICILMDHAHTTLTLKEIQLIQYNQNDNNNEEFNPIGVDEDPDQLKN